MANSRYPKKAKFKDDNRLPGDTPDYSISLLNKETDQRAYVGVAWLKEEGRISIKLNLGTVLTSDPNLIITLFPFRSVEELLKEHVKDEDLKKKLTNPSKLSIVMDDEDEDPFADDLPIF